jgi:hypothetical protein
MMQHHAQLAAAGKPLCHDLPFFTRCAGKKMPTGMGWRESNEKKQQDK